MITSPNFFLIFIRLIHLLPAFFITSIFFLQNSTNFFLGSKRPFLNVIRWKILLTRFEIRHFNWKHSKTKMRKNPFFSTNYLFKQKKHLCQKLFLLLIVHIKRKNYSSMWESSYWLAYHYICHAMTVHYSDWDKFCGILCKFSYEVNDLLTKVSRFPCSFYGSKNQNTNFFLTG